MYKKIRIKIKTLLFIVVFLVSILSTIQFSNALTYATSVGYPSDTYENEDNTIVLDEKITPDAPKEFTYFIEDDINDDGEIDITQIVTITIFIYEHAGSSAEHDFLAFVSSREILNPFFMWDTDFNPYSTYSPECLSRTFVRILGESEHTRTRIEIPTTYENSEGFGNYGGISSEMLTYQYYGNDDVWPNFNEAYTIDEVQDWINQYECLSGEDELSQMMFNMLFWGAKTAIIVETGGWLGVGLSFLMSFFYPLFSPDLTVSSGYNLVSDEYNNHQDIGFTFDYADKWEGQSGEWLANDNSKIRPFISDKSFWIKGGLDFSDISDTQSETVKIISQFSPTIESIYNPASYLDQHIKLDFRYLVPNYPCSISVDSPTVNQIVYSGDLVVSGTAEDTNGITKIEIFLSGSSIVKYLYYSGSSFYYFSATIRIPYYTTKAGFYINIIVYDSQGNTQTKLIYLINGNYNPTPPPPPPPTKPGAVPF